MTRIKNILPIVVKVLTQYPETRDSDYRLYFGVAVCMGRDLASMTAHKMLQDMEKGTLPSWETIGRCRRKAQEDQEDLRGDSWEKRHKEEGKVMKQLGYTVK